MAVLLTILFKVCIILWEIDGRIGTIEYFDVINPFGEKTGEIIERGEAHRKGICHRVIQLWIINSADQLLLQRRSAEKESGANLWYVSVGGHIESGETSWDTIVRETSEELGLDITPYANAIRYLYTFREINTEHNGRYIDDEFFDVYAVRADIDLRRLTLQKTEVQAVKYVNYEDFKQSIRAKDPQFVRHEVGYSMLFAALDDCLKSKQM